MKKQLHLRFLLIFFSISLRINAQEYALRLWGYNTNVLLETNTTREKDARAPLLPMGVSNLWREVSVSDYGGVAIKNDGTLWAWGQNTYGQVGDGTTSDRTTPVQISSATSWSQVIHRGVISIALKTNGTVYEWGQTYDEVGTPIPRLTPTLLTTLSSVVQIAGNVNHTLALLSNGMVKAWGYNGFGELGDGTKVSRLNPALVLGLSSVTKIAAGDNHSLALLSDGTVKAWGSNLFGELGDGSTTDKTLPVSVLGLNAVTQIAAGSSFSFALLSSGTIKSWGYNSCGQLGNGAIIFTQSLVPVSVVGITNATYISAGNSNGLALLADGTAKVWGCNPTLQLGVSSSEPMSSTPNILGNYTNIEQIGGAFNCFYILSVDNCSTPIPSDVTVAVNGNQATLSWTQSAAQNKYDIYFAPDGATIPDASTIPSVSKLTISSYTFTMVAGTNYRAYVRATCSTSSKSDWSDIKKFAIAPANDLCVNATTLIFDGAAATGSTWGAHQNGGFCLGNEVWYKFNAASKLSAKVAVKFDAPAEGRFNYLVYEGSDLCNVLYSLPCQDLLRDNDYEFLINGLAENQEYYIAIGTFDHNRIPGFTVQLTDNSADVTIPHPTINPEITYNSCNYAKDIYINFATYNNTNKWIPIVIGTNIVASINPQGHTLNTVSTQVYINDGALRSTGGRFYLDRNFKITPETQPDLVTNPNKVKVRFYLTNAEISRLLTALGGATIANLGVSKFPDTDPFGCSSAVGSTSPSFITSSGNQAVFNNAGKYIEFEVSSFSEFFISNQALVLPLELVDFGVNTEGGYNHLNWLTTSEKNVANFDIERGMDGQNFEKIGQVKATNIMSSSPHKYSFTDNNADKSVSNIWYYRLKINDLDGQSSYSKIVSTEQKGKSTPLSIFPNPTDKIIMVRLETAISTNVLTLTDMLGRIVFTKNLTSTKGVNEWTIDLPDLPAGVYWLRIGGEMARLMIR
jgi:alpha-tubulin suppressor-like RCC1 family protein